MKKGALGRPCKYNQQFESERIPAKDRTLVIEVTYGPGQIGDVDCLLTVKTENCSTVISPPHDGGACEAVSCDGTAGSHR
jgi:hypothetical protein